MRWLLQWSTISALAIVGSGGAADDLAKIERRLSRELQHHSNSQYCLLVFGPEAKARVWLAFDGNVLYADRNGNGDLTDVDERLEPISTTELNPPNPIRTVRDYRLDALVVSDGKKEYRIGDVLQITPDYAFRVESKEEKALRSAIESKPDSISAAVLRAPGGVWINVDVTVDGKWAQRGIAKCSDQPRNAPILHFDGPLTFALAQPQANLTRTPGGNDLSVQLVTPGVGEDSLTYMGYQNVSEKLQPVAEIEFPSQDPAGRTIRVKATLRERC